MNKSLLMPYDYIYMPIVSTKTVWLYKIRLDKQLENGEWVGYYHWGHSTRVRQSEISHITATVNSPNIIKYSRDEWEIAKAEGENE